MKTDKKTGKGANTWISGNHEFGSINTEKGTSIAFFPSLENLAYTPKATFGGDAWVEGNHDFGVIKAKKGSAVVLSTTPEKKLMDL